MKFLRFIPLIVSIFLLSAPPSPAQKPFPYGKDTLESGVQESLAIYRKKTLSVVRYDLQFIIPASKKEAIIAYQLISFHCNDISRPVVIDFKEQRDHLQDVTVNNEATAVHFEKEHLIIDPEQLKKGNNQVLIRFIAGDLSLNRNDEYLYTLLVPERARTVFPCFDQPDLKAVFSLSLQIPADWKAVTNGPLKDSSILDDAKIYRYSESDTISTYLFSFAAGKFQQVTRTIKGRVMNFYHRETDTAKISYSMDAIFKIHADALGFLENYTKIPFPFKKFDFMAIPDFQYGGMEHPGAIFYKAASLFLDSGATRDQEIDRSNLLAHETAHMWFGDLVTMRWFNDVWMKEVFANFMADKITRVAIPGTNYALKFLQDHYPAAYGIDRTAGANPIRQQLSNLQDAGSLYGNIIYHKAPVVMLQLETLMGKQAFQKGLQEYLKTFSFGNASWPELIAILDRYTPKDLQAWNNTWVNESGRPTFSYTVTKNNNLVTRLQIDQQGEHEPVNRVWQQSFKIELVYADKRKPVTVNIYGPHTIIKEAEGKPVPLYILFNTSGTGYGVFPADSAILSKVIKQSDPVIRTSAYISFYENMLNGRNCTPRQFINTCRTIIPNEQEELALRLLTGQLNTAFWQYLLPASRNEVAGTLEYELWSIMQKASTANKKKILFKSFQSIALITAAQDTLYSIWNRQQPPAGIKLNEDDYLSIATTLALRNYKDTTILQQQLARTKNPDRRKRLEFLLPSLSPDVKVRDAFFETLKDEKNREIESWVLTALQNLHHPLRSAESQRYLKTSLDLLSEIQLTGDIFFPQSWLQSTFGYYQTTYAAGIVRNFLESHPGYNPKLNAKILQSTDGLFRAEKIAE